MPLRTCDLQVVVVLVVMTGFSLTIGDEGGIDNMWPPFCPHGCTCDASRRSSLSQMLRRTVDCGNMDLKAFPGNITGGVELFVFSANHLQPEALESLDTLVNLTELDLANNHLYGLAELKYPMPTLRYISVDRNEIDYLNNRTFRSVPNLIYLSVAGNKMEIMHSNAFGGLGRLRTLDLSANRIFSIDPQWFRDLVSLQDLSLRDNNIHVLRDSVFMFPRDLRRLDLSKNQINHVYNNALKGLSKLQAILLQGNHLKTVPREALRQLDKISLINLGSNHMERLLPGDFENGSVAIVKLNDMSLLRLVEAHAFSNLPDLVRLELTNSPQLQYIDRQAFLGLPKLHSLLVHNNNLSSLEEAIGQSLPSLATLSVHDNPLVCDCVANWLVQEGSRHLGNLTIPALDQTLCALPPSLKGTAFTDPKLLHISDSCAPRLVPLFERAYDPVLGDNLRLDCRAVGVPTPQTDWLLPASGPSSKGDGLLVLKAKRPGSTNGHRDVLDSGSLVIHYVQGTDHGDYTCLASNPKGRDERTAQIRVKNLRANVIIIHVSSSAVTLTWKSVRYDHEYQILYKATQSNSTYHAIDIKPYMRTYTASELLPATSYDICIAVKHTKLAIRINCTSIITRSRAYDHLGVTDLRGYVIGGAVGFIIIIITLSCTVAYFVRRYNKRRKAQEELFSDNLSQLFLASMDSMSDMTPITYENRGAEMFDDDDLEEIRSTASMATTTSNTSTMKC